MDTSIRDTLVTTLGLADMPQTDQDALIEKFGGLVFQSVLLRVAPEMSSSAQDKLEALLSKDTSPEDLLAFLRSEAKDFDTIVREEALALKAERDAIMSQVGH